MQTFKKLNKRLAMKLDVIEKCRDWLTTGAMEIAENGTPDDFKIKMRKTLDINNGYILVRKEKDPTRRCGLYHEIFFTKLGYLPYRCLDCWKNVIRPKTLKEMDELATKLYEVHDNGILNRDWKYGHDTREYTFGRYGMYVYNNSLEEAEETKKLLLELDFPEDRMWVQRGCSEMNNKFGRSDEWHLPDEEIERQKWLESKFEFNLDDPDQVEIAREDVMSRVIRWAYCTGDETWEEYVEEDELGEKLYPNIIKYG
jgi:hypothetical protein